MMRALSLSVKSNHLVRHVKVFWKRFTSGPILLHVDQLTPKERQAMREQIQTQGFAVTPRPILQDETRQALKLRYEALFCGDFETGIYPDEWHWRHGLSLPNVTREICNAYKSDRLVASVVLNEKLAALAAVLQGWSSVRIGQDDVIWKPPAGASLPPSSRSQPQVPKTTIGFHRDSAYISQNFEPYANNMVTVWMALDDADEETGCIEYVPGSHLWDTNTSSGDKNLDESSSSSLSSLTFFSDKQHVDGVDGLPSHQSSLPSNVTRQNIVRVKCPAGHAIFHHQDVWHGSGPNQSLTRHRRALVAHLLNGSVQWRQPTRSNKKFGNAGLPPPPPPPPWTHTTYIYGRYRRSGTTQLDEDFFPILYASPESGVSRTPWLATYVP